MIVNSLYDSLYFMMLNADWSKLTILGSQVLVQVQ